MKPGGAERDESGFSRRILVWIVGAAVVSFALALVFSGLGEALNPVSSAGANSYSYSAVGHRALLELLESLEMGVLRRQLRAGIGTGPHHPLLLLEPDPEWVGQDDTGRLGALVAEVRRRQADLILVLPKWQSREDRNRRGALEGVWRWQAEQIGLVLEGLGEPLLESLRVRRGGELASSCRFGGDEVEVEITDVQLLGRAPGLESLLSCAGGVLVAETVLGDGPRVVIVADPDLLNNQGLGRGDHAATVYRLLSERLEAEGVVVDETVHGFSKSGGLIAEGLRFPLVLAVAQGGVVLALVLWAGMGRFGKPLALEGRGAVGKRLLIQNTALLLAVGGHAGDTLSRYYQQTLRYLAAQHSLSAGLSASQLRERLEDHSRQRGLTVKLAELEAQIVSVGGLERPSRRALELAQRLYRWRQEMTHGAR